MAQGPLLVEETRRWKLRDKLRLEVSMSDQFYCRYYVGHKGKFGHEFMEFEFSSSGKLRYANSSNYKNLMFTAVINDNKDYVCTLFTSPGMNRPPHPDHPAHAPSSRVNQHAYRIEPTSSS